MAEAASRRKNVDYKQIITEAKTRLAALDNERQLLLSFIQSAEALAESRTQAIVAAGVEVGAERVSPRAEPQVAESKKPTGVIMGATVNAVERILNSKGQPMRTRDLVPLVLKEGVEIGGKNQVATLSARLHNSGAFTNHGHFGWWFAGRQLPKTQNLGLTIFDEAEGQSLAGQPSASSHDDEGR